MPAKKPDADKIATLDAVAAGPNLAETVRDVTRAGFEPRTMPVHGLDGMPPVEILVLPDGGGGLTAMSVKPFQDEWRDAPERREGIARLDALDSFIDHVKRFADKGSALFAIAEATAPSIQCVLDYHLAGADGGPRFGRHRARHEFPLSDEWRAWTAINGKAMDQADFASFLEDRIADVMVPDPALLGSIKERDAGGDFGDKTPLEMLADYARTIRGDFATPSGLVELSRGLAVHAGQQVEETVNLQSGETKMKFVEEHTDKAGAPLKVPNLFLIGVPVFRHGTPYRIAVRLRYRLRAGGISWAFELYRHDKVFEAAFRESCARAQVECGLPLFYGAPESAT